MKDRDKHVSLLFHLLYILSYSHLSLGAEEANIRTQLERYVNQRWVVTRIQINAPSEDSTHPDIQLIPGERSDAAWTLFSYLPQQLYGEIGIYFTGINLAIYPSQCKESMMYNQSISYALRIHVPPSMFSPDQTYSLSESGDDTQLTIAKEVTGSFAYEWIITLTRKSAIA